MVVMFAYPVAVRDHQGVLPGGRKVFVGFGQPRTKDGLQLFPAIRIAQVFGLQPGQLEIYGRQITASIGQIAGEVAQNVDQLQGFAKADGEGEKFGIIQLGVRETIPAREARPEFPNTAGDVIGVVVQILGGFQRLQFANLSVDVAKNGPLKAWVT